MRVHGKGWAAVLVPLVAVAGAGVYVALDVADVVPGFLTSAPREVPPAEPPAAASAASLGFPDHPTVLDVDAPVPAASKVQGLANRLAGDARVGASTSVTVVDILTGERLADVDGGDAQIPASNTKLFTGLALYRALGPDYRLRTTVTWSGEPAASGRTKLTLVAGGDMMLAADAGHGGAQRGANGYAGLGDLADATVAALAEAGVTRVSLGFDDSAFAGPAVNPRWPSSAVADGYVAPVTGMAVNVGKTRDEEYPPRFADPSRNAAEVFAQRLEDRGIDVAFAGERGGQSVELAAVESAPLSDVLAHMLQYSDNTIAEDMVMVLAIAEGRKGTIENGVDEVIAQLNELGVDTSGVRLFDGSGYARDNRISTRALARAITLTAGDPTLDDYLELLPVGGMQGTLADRFEDGDAAGLVRAKTGSLTGVSSLSGTVVTADGRWLAFSILADGMPYGQDAPRAAFDAFVEGLASCGCG